MELANNEINKIIQDLLLINQTLEANERERKKTELYDSNRFNPFQFMRTDEMGLSKIIAFLLDPKERHGQGDLFLNSFLKYINKPYFLAYDNAQVVVEKLTSKNRRHDIFIEGYLNGSRKWVISIENKLKFASDQSEQLKDYQKDIEENYSQGDYCLVYLPVFKEEPSDESISRDEWNKLIDEGKAVLLSAEDLILWLDDTPIIAPAIKQFCDGFKRYLNEDLMGNTKDTNVLAESLMKNNDALYSALSVLQSSDQIYEKLLDELVKQLNEKLPFLSHYNFSCGRNRKYSQKEFVIYIEHNKHSWGICIEFESSYLKNAYYGVYCIEDDSSDSAPEGLAKLLNEIFEPQRLEGNFNAEEDWILWRYLDGDYLNWDANILRQIPDGTLADYIYKLWKPLLDIIVHNMNEIEKLKK